MKKTIILIAIAFCLFSKTVCAQVSGTDTKLVYLDEDKFLELISNSDTKFHLLYSYGYWCKPCVETMPKLLEVVQDNEDIALYPLIAEKQGSTAIPKTFEELKSNYGYTGLIYAADIGYDKKPYNQYKKFIAEIAPNHSDFGMSLILLFNSKKELLYATTFHQSSQEKIDGLKSVLMDN